MALTLNLADVQLPARGLQSIQLVPRGDCPTSRYVGLLLTLTLTLNISKYSLCGRKHIATAASEKPDLEHVNKSLA